MRRGPKAEKLAACRELSQQGAAAMDLGQWQQAEALLHRALEASPDDADARRNMAECLWQRGARTEATTHLAAAMRARPNDARLTVRAGEMALAMGARDEALAYAEHAVRLDPRLASAWALRGRVFWQLQQTDRAVADLARTLELSPDDANVLLDMARLQRERGQPARCLTTLHHLHDLHPPDGQPQLALILEGLALLDLGRPLHACDVFAAAARREPANAQFLYYLAHAQYASGRYDESANSAQQALAIDATHQPSRQLLTQLATKRQADDSQHR